MGVVAEDYLLSTVAGVVELLRRYRAGEKGGRPIDVLNLSLSYYHETPQDGQFSTVLYMLLTAARALGCTVVCSAGNDAIDRPTFPAALWAWDDSPLGLEEDGFARHLSVGALNPSAHSVALFSNVGPWVRTFALGASVVSASPAFVGGLQPTSRDDLYGHRRQTVDPDDYRGGFAVWSGTSFAAPLVAGHVARLLDGELGELGGEAKDAGPAIAVARAATDRVLALVAEGDHSPVS